MVVLRGGSVMLGDGLVMFVLLLFLALLS